MPSRGGEEEEKPCRACSDFKSWAKKQTKTSVPTQSTSQSVEKLQHKDCPLDKDELGRSTWGLLHSMSLYYPEKPTKKQADEMTQFFNIFAQFYPCEPCAIDFQDDIKKNPPKTKTRDELAKWLCERHNTVNAKLDKPQFDCSKIFERWRDGWADGSCD